MQNQSSFEPCLNTEDKDNKEIILKLSENLKNVKYFINHLRDNIKESKEINNTNNIFRLIKMSYILPNAIKEIGLPICDLINNNNEIIQYYINNILSKNKDYEISKSIIINYINIFNFNTTDINPSDKLLDLLKKTDIDVKGIKDNRRIKKTNLESLYDELIVLYTTWKAITDMEDGIEEDGVEQLKSLLNEKIDKINEIKKSNTYSNAVIEFLMSKVKQIEDFMNEQKRRNSEKFNLLNSPSNSFNQSNGQLNLNENQFSVDEKELKQLREQELSKRTFFYKNEKLAYGEDQITEFKNYYYPLMIGQEKELKRQYIGFLNSTGGRIYIGINDQKEVKGIVLTYKNCDLFRNNLVGFSNDFYPNCRLDKIKVYFIPIKNPLNKIYITNLYVVKIIILPGDPYCLYSITKKGGFTSAIRKQSQVFNLDAEEINKEIIQRYELKRNLSNQLQVPKINLGFDDPEPDKNFQVPQNIDSKIVDLSKQNDEKRNKSLKKVNNSYIYTVNVRNIDTNLKIKEINKCFTGCQQSYQKFYSKEGKSLGFGKIQFASEEAAKKVMEKFNGEKLGGNKSIIMTLVKKKNFNIINNK